MYTINIEIHLLFLLYGDYCYYYLFNNEFITFIIIKELIWQKVFVLTIILITYRFNH